MTKSSEVIPGFIPGSSRGPHRLRSVERQMRELSEAERQRNERIGARIAALRENLHLRHPELGYNFRVTQQQIAELMSDALIRAGAPRGVSSRSVQNWELGSTGINDRNLNALLEVLHASREDIYDDAKWATAEAPAELTGAIGPRLAERLDKIEANQTAILDQIAALNDKLTLLLAVDLTTDREATLAAAVDPLALLAEIDNARRTAAASGDLRVAGDS